MQTSTRRVANQSDPFGTGNAGDISVASPHQSLPPAKVKVWDPFVRLFHWAVVVGVGIDLIFDAGTGLHMAAGYVVLSLVLLRLIWGGIGSPHARFASFVTSPSTALHYLRDEMLGRSRRHIGHNPPGGLMVLALLGALMTAGASGALLNTDTFWGAEWLEQLHEFAANALYALIPIHLAGVAIASVFHRENLVRAMITGFKRR